MPVLPPTAASTMPARVVGNVHDANPAKPGRRDPTREVGGGAATQADDRVRTGETDIAQDVPAVARRAQRLCILGVGHLDDVGVEARAR